MKIKGRKPYHRMALTWRILCIMWSSLTRTKMALLLLPRVSKVRYVMID